MKTYRFTKGIVSTQNVDMPLGNYRVAFDGSAIRPLDSVNLEEEPEIVLVYGENGRVVEVLISVPDSAQPLETSEALRRMPATAPSGNGNGRAK